MGLKAVFFDLDDTLYGSFQACDAYAYERLAAWAEEELGVSGEDGGAVHHGRHAAAGHHSEIFRLSERFGAGADHGSAERVFRQLLD